MLIKGRRKIFPWPNKDTGMLVIKIWGGGGCPETAFAPLRFFSYVFFLRFLLERFQTCPSLSLLSLSLFSFLNPLLSLSLFNGFLCLFVNFHRSPPLMLFG